MSGFQVTTATDFDNYTAARYVAIRNALEELQRVKAWMDTMRATPDGTTALNNILGGAPAQQARYDVAFRHGILQSVYETGATNLTVQALNFGVDAFTTIY
jgi:hypothetical protein